MELSIQKWGNSAAVRLPAALLEQLKLMLGDKLTVDLRPEGILLKPARPRYVLAELVAQCDPDAPMPAELAAWHHAGSAGHEAW
ncbi:MULTISPECIES: AbrB/MazE/SpoVT family DNA-binding domain-containing protein [Cupriavidus]